LWVGVSAGGRFPAPSPLLGDVGCGAGAAGRVEDEIAGVGGHEDAALNDACACLNYVDNACSASNISPDVRDRISCKIIYKPDICGSRLSRFNVRLSEYG
jgi:hypothetical protein